MLDRIIFIHPTKCAGTAISERLFKLKGYSDNNSALYSGYFFNGFFNSKESFKAFAISLSNDAPLFLEFVIKQSSLQKIQHWNEHFVHHPNLQDFQED